MISRGRARWAKTERAQWSRDHQTNNTVPTQNGASCCAPFFFFCRSRFCFFFFFPRPTVLLFHRSRPPRRPPHVLAAFVHAVSNAMDLRWIPPRFSKRFWRAGPPLPPRNEEDRVDRTVLRYGQHRIYGRRRIYRRSTVGSVETRSSLAGNIFEDSSQGQSLDRRVSLYPVSYPSFPRLSFFFLLNKFFFRFFGSIEISFDV